MFSVFPVTAGSGQANCSDNCLHESPCLRPSETASLCCFCLHLWSPCYPSGLHLPSCLQTNAECFGFVLQYHSSFSTNFCSSYLFLYNFCITNHFCIIEFMESGGCDTMLKVKSAIRKIDNLP